MGEPQGGGDDGVQENAIGFAERRRTKECAKRSLPIKDGTPRVAVFEIKINESVDDVVRR